MPNTLMVTVELSTKITLVGFPSPGLMLSNGFRSSKVFRPTQIVVVINHTNQVSQIRISGPAETGKRFETRYYTEDGKNRMEPISAIPPWVAHVVTIGLAEAGQELAK